MSVDYTLHEEIRHVDRPLSLRQSVAARLAAVCRRPAWSAFSLSGWLRSRWPPTPPTNPKRKRSCILLWMNGGPSQMDTFDLKPGHANGGPFKEIATTVPGIKISEHLPKSPSSATAWPSSAR